MIQNSNRIYILGIPFDFVTLLEASEKVYFQLKNESAKKPFFIATPNPEMLLEAQKDKLFFNLLQTTDLNITDGMGIVFASKINHTPLPERVTGTDLMQEICGKIFFPLKIFLLGAAPGVAERVKIELEKNNPHVSVVGTFAGSALPNEEKDICERINKSQADILFVAFGAPKQEFWIARNLPHLSDLKVVIGVGGAFDFIANVRKRAPRWMQKVGLEWLYRLVQQPSRWRRIYHATIKFPLFFFWRKLKP